MSAISLLQLGRQLKKSTKLKIVSKILNEFSKSCHFKNKIYFNFYFNRDMNLSRLVPICQKRDPFTDKDEAANEVDDSDESLVQT